MSWTKLRDDSLARLSASGTGLDVDAAKEIEEKIYEESGQQEVIYEHRMNRLVEYVSYGKPQIEQNIHEKRQEYLNLYHQHVGTSNIEEKKKLEPDLIRLREEFYDLKRIYLIKFLPPESQSRPPQFQYPILSSTSFFFKKKKNSSITVAPIIPVTPGSLPDRQANLKIYATSFRRIISLIESGLENDKLEEKWVQDLNKYKHLLTVADKPGTVDHPKNFEALRHHALMVESQIHDGLSYLSSEKQLEYPAFWDVQGKIRRQPEAFEYVTQRLREGQIHKAQEAREKLRIQQETTMTLQKMMQQSSSSSSSSGKPLRIQPARKVKALRRRSPAASSETQYFLPKKDSSDGLSGYVQFLAQSDGGPSSEQLRGRGKRLLDVMAAIDDPWSPMAMEISKYSRPNPVISPEVSQRISEELDKLKPILNLPGTPQISVGDFEGKSALMISFVRARIPCPKLVIIIPDNYGYHEKLTVIFDRSTSPFFSTMDSEAVVLDLLTDLPVPYRMLDIVTVFLERTEKEQNDYQEKQKEEYEKQRLLHMEMQQYHQKYQQKT